MIGSFFVAALALVAANPNGAVDRYAAGQVWAYRTRPGDEGSLLKIQAIERDAAALRGSPIYHVSVVGVHFTDPQIAPMLPHIPVSRDTLDASVTQQVTQPPDFPDAAPGIAQWREARGGVYTIPIASIVTAIDTATAIKP